LVPDALVINMIEDRLARAGDDPSFIFDGFPRTVAQADALEHMLAARQIPLDHVMNIAVPRDDVVRRLSGRRTCARCGTMFHVDFDPSRRPASVIAARVSSPSATMIARRPSAPGSRCMTRPPNHWRLSTARADCYGTSMAPAPRPRCWSACGPN
jgi:adenylate kinase